MIVYNVDIPQKSLNFLLEIMTLVSSANILTSEKDILLEEDYLCILWNTRFLNWIPKELHVLLFLVLEKNSYVTVLELEFIYIPLILHGPKLRI
jgi:hypothetical protein